MAILTHVYKCISVDNANRPIKISKLFTRRGNKDETNEENIFFKINKRVGCYAKHDVHKTNGAVVVVIGS